MGARNALHSKAPRLLTMLLAEDIVKASELKTEKVGLSRFSLWLLHTMFLPGFAVTNLVFTPPTLTFCSSVCACVLFFYIKTELSKFLSKALLRLSTLLSGTTPAT